MLISSTIPNLVNGISQQPSTLRLASQAEDQINFISSVADGLTRRPGTRHLTKLSNDDWSDAFIHTINRDVVERYLLVIRENQLRIFESATGIERTVNAPGGWGYLSGGDKHTFRAVTVADFTFILNRNKTTEMSPTITPKRKNEALVQVRGGNYGKRYRIYINEVVAAEFVSRDGSQSVHISDTRTEQIAISLRNSFNTIGLTGYSIVRRGDLLVITKDDDTPFSLRVGDDAGGVLLVAIQGRAQRFSDLPKEAPDGFTVEIAGDPTSSFDNYHVQYEAVIPSASDSTGVWKETLKGEEQFQFDNTTMPHVLIREADGTFTFKQADWLDRKVGDVEKVPNPSFIGRGINDIFFFRNRLGFIADENVFMSQAGEFFTLWRSTATTVLDSDPIDLAVTNAKVSILNFAVPFNQNLLLFSDQSQFILDAGDVLTPSTVAINQATAFESSDGVRPVGVGQFVYFPVPRSGFTGLREYFVRDGGDQNDALDVTSHVPRFLPKNIFLMAASSSEDMIAILSTEVQNTLWVYKFFSSDEGKLQSAWSRWVLSEEDNILNAAFLESTIFLLISRAGGTYVETLTVGNGDTEEGSEILYHCDRGIYETATTRTFNAATNTTTVTLPYLTEAPITVLVRAGDTVFPEGLIVRHTRPNSQQVTLEGDWTNTKLFIGLDFESSYVFSTFHLKSDEAGGGMTSNSEGRLQLRYLAVDFARTAYFELITQAGNRIPSVSIFSGRKLGVASGLLNTFHLDTGRFRAPVLSRNVDAKITIRSSSFLPCSFTSATWEATYNTRARRV